MSWISRARFDMKTLGGPIIKHRVMRRLKRKYPNNMPPAKTISLLRVIEKNTPLIASQVNFYRQAIIDGQLPHVAEVEAVRRLLMHQDPLIKEEAQRYLDELNQLKSKTK